ncbi:MAG: archease [Candidatus Portnoybacteria bacterium CG_4_8_14_3_um_filter_40_10]|uniref:Archease n=4 Tax=Candidatus Portnoyibacteriota TaxID=1817913 RepID=A0A2M7II86_9BACT|nr:MAG: archease [Candidatus Portnoybacteria bacterium CG11_big_fil_rev_8_21_14_0_20_40_15]PIS31137.1 MAG: archease [Candidatus Portnoybacteria bacterium CG08_land_8_20_14_0_20_40_83]PIW76212.1 MAG: archease [Candidatus Portnoybacteria bacterium CG_4_8_14_3_um_filter_40_10]PIY74347.1 MAG: archease [Candidatus Portnoybacteria bacterium CG_4_10_14_0_8_um_filter_40_50]PJA64534.1 MAG: archease [Candidatus Portnoybacteria bacterium CG_4_9_14_3_um_filter_40_10]
MDKKYEILDHPADLKIKAFGKDLAEVFVNAALAIADQQTRFLELAPKSAKKEEEILIESDGFESLLVDWLSEILYRSEINKKVYNNFEVTEFLEDPYKIKAKIKGIAVESKNIDIKAVTYHNLEIKKISDHWEAVIVFDI